MADTLLTIDEVSQRLRTPVATLRYWRHAGLGPSSIRLGRRVFYSATEIDRYIAELFEAERRREPVVA